MNEKNTPKESTSYMNNPQENNKKTKKMNDEISVFMNETTIQPTQDFKSNKSHPQDNLSFSQVTKKKFNKNKIQQYKILLPI